jgi:hypothetical protein
VSNTLDWSLVWIFFGLIADFDGILVVPGTICSPYNEFDALPERRKAHEVGGKDQMDIGGGSWIRGREEYRPARMGLEVGDANFVDVIWQMITCSDGQRLQSNIRNLRRFGDGMRFGDVGTVWEQCPVYRNKDFFDWSEQLAGIEEYVLEEPKDGSENVCE